jgi:hypothetical protein
MNESVQTAISQEQPISLPLSDDETRVVDQMFPIDSNPAFMDQGEHRCHDCAHLILFHLFTRCVICVRLGQQTGPCNVGI